MDETDADGEWSDEEVLQSGSQTGLSETEQEDGQRTAVIQIQRPRPPFNGIVKNEQLTMTSSYPLSVPPSTDPVSVMMDKIDAELLAIEKEETMASRPRKLNDNVRPNEIGQKYANSGTPEVEFSDPRTPGARAVKESSNSDILSFKKSLTTEGKDLNEPKIVPEVPKDLDPITASEIDAKFKEIMSKKKDQNPESVLETSRLSGRPPRHSLTNDSRRVTIQESLVPQSAHDQGRQLENLIARLRLKNVSRPSATMLSSGGYATDNESVKTEDFESKFFSLMVNPTEAERQQTLVKRIEEQTQHSTTDGAPHSILKVQLSRPRSCSPVRMRLQRYRTTDNSRGFWDSKLNVNKKGSQVFSWDDEFWKQSSRRGPQSVASSFEEVESLCLSKSSSDSMGSSQRPWDRLGHGQDPGMWGSKRRFMSRQSSTTSTSTSRSSGLVGDHVISEAHGEQVHQNASIKDTLLESMELLGAHGNLDLAEKIYLEKIFHRVLDWNNGMPVSSSNSSKAMDKHFWNSIQNQAANKIRDRQGETDSPRLQASLKERLERLNQSEQSPTKSKMVLQLPNPAEKKRRRDLIVPDEEDLSSSSYKQLKASAKPESVSRTSNPPLSSKEANLSSKDFSSGDTASRYSYLSSLSSISMDNSSQRGSQIGSNAPQRMQSPSLATFLPPTFRLSGSFESTASPPDTYMFNQPYTPSHAERVLMGLGFGATEGFLPERFLRDWYSKIAKAQMEAQIAAQAEVKTPDISESSPTFPPNTPVTVEHEMQKAERRDSHVSTASSMLDEAANFFPSNMSQDSKIQQLKEYIAAYSNHANSPTEGRDFKIRHFATTRQKSLPLFLETLSEEEEGRSRISGVDPFDKEARLRMFISDAMSSSGKSTGSNSENSYISSNQSESDSVSSCSDNRSSLQRKNQHIKAYKKHLDEEHKMEIERKEKELKARKQTEDENDEHEERRRHRHPKGSPVRQSTVRRNENFGKATNAPGSDCPVTTGHQLQLQDAEISKTTTESQPTDNKFNTGAKQDSMHSKDSIEVEEIIQFQLSKTKFGRTKDDKTESISTNQVVEPAMVSIVLEDVDRDANHCDNTLPISYLGLTASRCSSSSLSPIPQSPVTVIEVGLDNQQDSLDTEGTGSSKETDDDNCLLQTSSSDDTGARKHGRCKSRSSKSLNTPGHDDFPRRRNSTASPLPSFQSRLSPSGDYGEMKPRRRLSLEVPIMPEIRFMLERQRAYSIGQLNDDPQLSQVRETVGKRATATENERLDNNNAPEEKNFNPQEHRSSSQMEKSDSKHFIDKDEMEVMLDKRGDTKPNDGLRRKSTPQLGQCQCCSGNQMPTMTALKKESSLSKSNESSPGSARSAFRIATKSKRETYSGHEKSSNIKDLEEMNTSQHVFKPQLITDRHHSGVDCGSIHRQRIRTSDLSTPPLNFSDSRPVVKDFGTSSGSRNKIHCISRAVQVNEASLLARPIPHSYLLQDSCFYYACDRWTQCSNLDHGWSLQSGFHKSTQTGVPTFEMSCQTSEFHDGSHANRSGDSLEISLYSFRNFETKAVNTVVSLIGREHEYDHSLSVPRLSTSYFPCRFESTLDFRFVDETLEQIERELSLIEKKKCVNYLNLVTNANAENNKDRKERREILRDLKLTTSDLSSIDKCYKKPKRSKSLNEEITASSSTDKTEHKHIKELQTSFKDGDIQRKGLEDSQHISEKKINKLFPLGLNTTLQSPSSFSNSPPHGDTISQSDVGEHQNNKNISDSSTIVTPETKNPPLDTGHFISKYFNIGTDHQYQDYPIGHSDGGFQNSNIYRTDLQQNKAEIEQFSTGIKRSASVNKCQEKVTQWRRFSLPTIGLHKTTIRTHSKLSRLKYLSSSQNSCNSLDLELDFMNASDPLTKFSSENNDQCISFPKNKHDRSILSINDNKKHFSEPNAQFVAEAEFKDYSACHSVKPCNETVITSPYRTKPLSPKVSALRGSKSLGQPADTASGNSTPEICISPLKSFQMDFLQIPGSPKDYLTKAVYPVASSSSGNCSPYNHPGLKGDITDEMRPLEKSCVQDNATALNDNQLPMLEGKDEGVSLNKKQEYFHSVTYMKASLSDSDLPASTVDSTVDLSLRSSIEQSADELSDSSMLPRLSVDSTLEELKREKQSEEISIDVDTMDFSDFKKTWNNKGDNSGGAVNSEGVITPDFHTAMLNIQKGSHTSVKSNHIETIVQDSFDMEDVSNRSVAGSDILQLEELDIDLSQIKFSKTRSSSASSYSEPMLENLGSLSQDSLSSEEGKFLMNYLRIGDNLDDLLQVSDYGGTSPSPTKMRCLSEVNSTLSGNTEREEAHCESPKKKLATHLHVASSGVLAELSIYDDGTEKDTSKRVNKKNGMTSDTFGIKSTKTRVKATKSCETGLESYKNKKNYEKIDEIVDDSSGDECDKEILRINLNRPVRKRLMKTNSDPVDKDIFCRSKKVPTQTSELSDDKVEVEKRVDWVENKSTPDKPNSTEMMAIFQNVNLSNLQNRSNVSPLKVNEGDELAEYSLKPFSVLDQTSTACVLSVEFTKEDSPDISDANDDPIENLASELEMMLLLENFDSYAEHLSSLNEGPILSPARHFPLPQISEEGTVSEDASEGGGLNHKMLSFSDKASQDSDLGLSGNACIEEALPVVKDGNCVEDISVQVSEAQPASPKIIRLPTDNSSLFLLESYDADSVFDEAVSVSSPLTLNSVYSRRLDNQEMLNVNIRAVSPSSRVFDFAQSLVDSNIPIISPETSTEQSIDSLELTSSENGDNEALVTSDSEGLANTLSFDSHIFHFPPNNQVLETHTVEKKIDLLGTVVTKFASTHTVRFNHINAPPSNTDHEKHISTASLMIGDYRQAKKEKENNDSCIVQCSDNNRSCSGFEKDVKNRKTELQFDNSNVNMNTVSESKKEQLKEKVRALLLIDQPCKQESPRELEYEKSDKDLQVIEHGSQNDKIDKTCNDYYSDLEDTTLIHLDEAIDLKSRVKAMFMIEDRNAPGNIASEGQRVKVTTMFSQNSKEARSSFSSTSISDLDDTAGTEVEAPKQNCVRTQHKSDAASVAPGVEIRQKPRKLRTRDSLLKLHEQTNISSSMGSDNESDLVSALRNQGDYDVRERDLALGLLTADVIDEEDTTSEFHSRDSYSKNADYNKSIRVQSGKDCIKNSATVTQNSDSESDVVTKDINAPKVIIQQPSEDNSQESLRRLNLPLLNLAAVAGNSGLESGFGNMSPPTESSDTKYPFSAKHGSSSWLRRSPRMHFLSPNAALTQKKYYDCLQLRDYSASSATDESHPELEYLDILPKFSQYQSNKRADSSSDYYLSPQKKSARDKLPTFLLQEPDDYNESESRFSSYRLSIRSPEPRPGVHFDDLDDLIVVCDSNSTSTPPSNSSDTQNNVVQLETLEESRDEYSGQQWSINVDDFEQTYEPDMQFCKDKDSELHITDDEAEIQSIVGDSDNQDQNVLFGSSNNFEINKHNLVYDTNGEYLSEERNRDLFSQLHVQINDIHVNTDRKYNGMYSDIAKGISERSDHSWANRLSLMSEAESQPFFRSSSDSEIGVSQEPQLFVEDTNVISDAQAGSECYTESLIPWSNVIDNIATPGDILEDPQSQYKKLLSVTSHDSGFDSQGSPIELTTLRTSDWGSTLCRVVQDETVDPDIDENETNNLF